MMLAPFRAAVRPSAIVVLSAALMGAAGCGPSVWKPPAESFRAYPARPQKIDLRVALKLTPELRASKWEKKDCCVMEVGPSLAGNAEELARHVFREVVIVESDTATEGADATLTPRLVYIVRTVGACGPCDSIIALKVEWRLVRADGRPVWVDTIGGQAIGSTGGSAEKPLKAAVEDLFLKSERAMTESRAVLYAASKR
jgi:hypothetical protein